MKQAAVLAVLFTMFAVAVGQDGPANPLAGKKFVSLEKLESGLGPNGIVLDYWHIQFKDKSFSWRYSDVIETGSYEIDAKTGALAAKTRGRKLEASYDAKTGVLTWEKRKYKTAKSEK